MSSFEFPEIEPFGEAPRLRGSGHSNEMLRSGTGLQEPMPF
jgi:hypothetical protein